MRLLDCWIVGLLDCWIVGLLDCWIVLIFASQKSPLNNSTIKQSAKRNNSTIKQFHQISS